MIKKNFTFVVLFFVIFSITLNLYGKDNIVLRWNQFTLNIIKETKTPPPIAARALAIVHNSIFDAWAAYDNNAISTRRSGVLRRPKKEHTTANKEEAISFAAFQALVDLFPSQEATLVNFMTRLGYDATDNSIDPFTPTGIGNLAAFDVLSLRHEDGSNQLGDELGSIGGPYTDYTGYIPVNTSSRLKDPSSWQPINVAGIDQTFLVPHWGLVLPFALRSGDQFFVPSPVTYPSKEYLAQAEDILALSAGLDDRTKSIAEYWADGPGTVTPPGHWNVIAQFVSRRDHHTLDDDVKMFFILDNALCDAGIAAWYVKRFYNSIRPISAIHFLFNGEKILAWGGPGKGTKMVRGDKWQPYLATPPFPECVSGHSTFSNAAAEVLKLFTGSDAYGDSITVKRGSSLIEPGITPSVNVVLSWKTFTKAAHQAGFSRRLGGIHFKDGDLLGRELGRKIGKVAFNRASHFIEGNFGIN